MIGLLRKKKQENTFPNLVDSLSLYKDAILDSVEENDVKTASINFARLISVLEHHNQTENRFNAELSEAKKRFLVFQRTNGMYEDVAPNR